MQAAFLICSHTKAPTKKATTRSALLSLMRAAKHWTGLPAKRKAARFALHKLMKLSTPLFTHTERLTSPQMCHSPSFSYKPASPGNGVGNLWPKFPKFQDKPFLHMLQYGSASSSSTNSCTHLQPCHSLGNSHV
jgi:hypothetical protein